MKRKIINSAQLAIIICLCAMIGYLYADATTWNINNKPDASWFTGNVGDPAWNWMKAIDDLVELGANPGTGRIFYVDSEVTVEGDGTNWLNARDTLDEAVGLCTADRGDVILVAQGHSETMGAAADEVDLDVAGITVIGLGNGTLRPTFNYTGDVTGAFAIGAANIKIHNLRFLAGAADVNDAIEVESAGDNATISSCVFTITTNGTHEFLDSITVGDTANDLTVVGCLFTQGGGAANHGIYLDADVLNCTIKNNIMHGDYAVACIKGDEANDYGIIMDNVLVNGDMIGDGSLNTQPVIELADSDCTLVIGNKMAANVATNHLAMTVADDGVFLENFSTDDDGDDYEGTSRSGTAAVTASADG
jgi:hypothetical protein